MAATDAPAAANPLASRRPDALRRPGYQSTLPAKRDERCRTRLAHSTVDSGYRVD